MTSSALLRPITIARDENEKCFIEPSVNSVRISVKIKQSDDTEIMLCRKFAGFFTQRADTFFVLRREPIDGYDVSFLITNEHFESLTKDALINFVIQFIEDIDREIKDMKLALNTRVRGAALAYMTQFVG
mmetsp:Transcript_3531/g.5445  ORF Transcript_3531/g.5445 Transcript_3531/m.5445 type:complete len:130 (+) Transcript_3531:128-517(+)